MEEKQNIEFKEKWDDKYLKWICGFANASGGKIFIGINDNGEIVGINNTKRLMDDLPNKIVTNLGIICDVNLHSKHKLYYIEIIVESYPNPVSYKGKYHYRSGSTKQELKGNALVKFMLERNGKRWDGVPIPNITVTDLDNNTFDLFRKRALRNNRIEENILTESNKHIVENLQLFENDYLKRAAILLFHNNPEKYVTGAYVKIGFFQTDAELIFQDEIRGSLFSQVEQTIDLLFSKYIKALISYEGINRIETYEYPKEAIREAILNAIAHKDYSSGIPIQISVYDDKIMIWNDGQLPTNWTVDNLLRKHSSKPYNPDIANAFFRSGYIESWGRGTIKIIEKCREAGLPEPVYECDGNDFWITFTKDNYSEKFLENQGLNKRQINAVQFVKQNGRIKNTDYQKLNSTTRKTATRDLSQLCSQNVFIKLGKGAGVYYELYT